MTHPLLDAGLELDCALRELVLNTRSPRVAQRVRDAAAEVRAELLALERGVPRTVTIDQVRVVLEQARRDGVGWRAIADAVRELQGDDGT
jgi:hypothetical protein